MRSIVFGNDGGKTGTLPVFHRTFVTMRRGTRRVVGVATTAVGSVDAAIGGSTCGGDAGTVAGSSC